MDSYDIVFMGHICTDEIERFGGASSIETGGAAFYSSMAACLPGLKIAVITRMAGEDHHLCNPLKEKDIDVHIQSSPETAHQRVLHPTDNPDERQIFQTKNAGYFEYQAVGFPVSARLIHLGGLSDREFSMEFISALKARGYEFSVDMQSFERQIDAGSGVLQFRDVSLKKEIIGMAKVVKLDALQAELLTGTADLSRAARIVESWGSPETMVTRADGVLVRSGGQEYFEQKIAPADYLPALSS
jgi:sugar/nucleoside kinase (ribokinase family)